MLGGEFGLWFICLGVWVFGFVVLNCLLVLGLVWLWVVGGFDFLGVGLRRCVFWVVLDLGCFVCCLWVWLFGVGCCVFLLCVCCVAVG